MHGILGIMQHQKQGELQTVSNQPPHHVSSLARWPKVSPDAHRGTQSATGFSAVLSLPKGQQPKNVKRTQFVVPPPSRWLHRVQKIRNEPNYHPPPHQKMRNEPNPSLPRCPKGSPDSSGNPIYDPNTQKTRNEPNLPLPHPVPRSKNTKRTQSEQKQP